MRINGSGSSVTLAERGYGILTAVPVELKF